MNVSFNFDVFDKNSIEKPVNVLPEISLELKRDLTRVIVRIFEFLKNFILIFFFIDRFMPKLWITNRERKLFPGQFQFVT